MLSVDPPPAESQEGGNGQTAIGAVSSSSCTREITIIAVCLGAHFSTDSHQIAVFSSSPNPAALGLMTLSDWFLKNLRIRCTNTDGVKAFTSIAYCEIKR